MVLGDARAEYITSGRTETGHFFAYILDPLGNVVKKIALQGRSHGIAYSKFVKTAVVFARRPGRYAIAFSPFNDQKTVLFEPPKNRHFYGHGVFSKDGSLLFTTENDFEEEKGIIGIYSAKKDFERIGEFYSGGIGPHEVLLSPNGKSLIVANGGIATHPDYPRDKLNLADMRPNISLINISDGKTTTSYTLSKDLYQISLRHLSLDAQGAVWIGGQYQGSKSDTVPLAFYLSNTSRLIKPLAISAEIQNQMKHYIGSVSVNISQRLMGMSAPRGNMVTLWNTDDRSLNRVIQVNDGCGIAANDGSFLVTSGQSQIVTLRKTTPTPGINWDNHITAI